MECGWKSTHLPHLHWLEVGWSSFLGYTLGTWKELEVDDSQSSARQEKKQDLVLLGLGLPRTEDEFLLLPIVQAAD